MTRYYEVHTGVYSLWVRMNHYPPTHVEMSYCIMLMFLRKYVLNTAGIVYGSFFGTDENRFILRIMKNTGGGDKQ